VATVEQVVELEVRSALEDLILRFVYFLIIEEYEDGTLCSTLLIYFSGVLGLLTDDSTFERAMNFILKLLD
jgi:hypothetical protein